MHREPGGSIKCLPATVAGVDRQAQVASPPCLARVTRRRAQQPATNPGATPGLVDHDVLDIQPGLAAPGREFRKVDAQADGGACALGQQRTEQPLWAKPVPAQRVDIPGVGAGLAEGARQRRQQSVDGAEIRAPRWTHHALLHGRLRRAAPWRPRGGARCRRESCDGVPQAVRRNRCSRCGDGFTGSQNTSNNAAAPCPPPTHMLTTA